MKKNAFIKKTCEFIAKQRSNHPVIPLLVDLMATGMCRPATSTRRGITDHTGYVMYFFRELGIERKGFCVNGVNIRHGYILGNDAPRGGRNGDFIKISFED